MVPAQTAVRWGHCIGRASAKPLSRPVQRVAQARGVPPEQIAALFEQHITSRSLGILGEPGVNVLILNLALQGDYPRAD
jgi:K+-transporting ATPase c subunit